MNAHRHSIPPSGFEGARLSRRGLMVKAGAVAVAATAVAVIPAAAEPTVEEKLTFYVAELQRLLAGLPKPFRVIVGSDHPVVVQSLAGKPFRPFRGVPADLWREEA